MQRSVNSPAALFLADIMTWMLRHLVAIAIAQSALVIGFGVMENVHDIEAGRVQLSPPCPVQLRTGHPCRTCGMTRGVIAVLHGQFRLGNAFNRWALPFTFCEFAILATGGILVLRRALRYRQIHAGPSTAPTRQRLISVVQSRMR